MRILRPQETSDRVGLCDRRIKELEDAGLFPRRFLISPDNGRACGHLEAEVDEWILQRANSRDHQDV